MPITTDADAPSVAISRLGQAEVAYRQSYTTGSPLPGPRIFLNTLSDGESESGAEFLGAQIADAQVPGGKAAVIGRPSVDVDERREARLLYDSNGVPRVVGYNDKGAASPLTLGTPFAGSLLGAANELPSASVMNPEGGGISAWPSSDPRGRPGVGVREDYPDGAVQTGLLSGGAGGPIGELAVGRSGLGDGLVAFQQGPIGDAAIVAGKVTAPPEPFVETLPKGWIRPTQARVSWVARGKRERAARLSRGARREDPQHAAGTALVQLPPPLVEHGHPRSPGAGDRHLRPGRAERRGRIKVDASAPSVRISRAGGRTVVVHVGDAGSGVVVGSVRVSFGDGHGSSRRTTVSHRYARAGTYLIYVTARSRVGNTVTLQRRVRVR